MLTPDQSRNADETFTKYLVPTVNVLYTLSGTLGEGISLVGITMSSLMRIFTLTSLSGFLAVKSNIHWYRCSPLGQLAFISLCGQF
jgi:hypothetical protein